MDFAQLLPVLKSVMGIASTGAGLYNSYENAQQANKIRGIVDDPRKMAAYTAGFTKPLTAGLEQGVANSAQGYAAERGLATSPAQEQQIYAQMIAPYIQQQQQQGQQAALQALGLGLNQNQNSPGGAASLTSGLEQLMKQFGQPKTSGTGGFNSPVFTGDNGPPPMSPDLTNWAGGGGSDLPDLGAIFGQYSPDVQGPVPLV